jgi:subtilisin-like proprotein convertase family protein
MSYCHLQFGNGGSIIMKFHDRCIELMRNRIDNAACLAPYSATARTVVTASNMTAVSAGDMTPSITDMTDFSGIDLGSAKVFHTFYLSNPGTQNLVLSGPVTITGSRQLSISTQPPSNTIEPGGASYFTVTFDPAVEGQHDATIAVASNDPQTPNFQFAVRGSAVRRAAPQSFIYAGGANIPDGSEQGISVAIPVSGITGGLMDLDFEIDGSLCSDSRYVGLQHPYVGDLRLVLESPSGTRVTLMDRPGGGAFGAAGQNFCGTVLNDESGGPSIQTITSSGSGTLAPPYSGQFTPAQPLSKFYGEPANGTWTVYAYDLQAPDPGVLRAVSLKITGTQAFGSSSVSDWNQY